MTTKTNPLELLVRSLQTHTKLGEADCRALLALPHGLRPLQRERFILCEGDEPSSSALLVSGFAFRQKLAGDGSRQILSLHIPGDPLDFQNLFLDVADHDIRTLTDAVVAFIPRSELQQLVRTRPAVSQAVFVHLLIESSIFREWIVNVGRRDAPTALAHVLCELAVRLKAQGLADDGGFDLPMSQEQLADVLGLTPVHVSRTMKILESKGLVARDKRRIHIPDWSKLCQVADFDGLYLHLQRQHAASI